MPPGIYEHRVYDPFANTWLATQTLGNVTTGNDFYGALCADSLGGVHALYVTDCTPDSPLWQFQYRYWDIDTTWGDPITLFEATNDQQNGIATYTIFALACNELTAEVFVVYRDLSDGASLKLATKGPDDLEFTFLEELQPASTLPHEYAVPTLRGSLFPECNRTEGNLDITFQHRPGGTTPYSLMYQNPATQTAPEFIRGDADGNGSFAGLLDGIYVLAYQFVSGSPPPPCLKAADADDSGSIVGLLDGIYILSYQFVAGSPPPPAPGAVFCGIDATQDSLPCDSTTCP